MEEAREEDVKLQSSCANVVLDLSDQRSDDDNRAAKIARKIVIPTACFKGKHRNKHLALNFNSYLASFECINLGINLSFQLKLVSHVAHIS